MTTGKAWIVSPAAAVLSLGLSVQPHPVPFWQNNIVIAAEEPASANSEVNTESSSTTKSAKMGENNGTQGGAIQGTRPKAKPRKLISLLLQIPGANEVHPLRYRSYADE